MTDFIDYYHILNLSGPNSSTYKIKENFRKLALLFHPDKQAELDNTANCFVIIYQAYETLINPKLKKDYDRTWVVNMLGNEGNDNKGGGDSVSERRRRLSSYKWECNNGIWKMYSLLNNECILTYENEFVKNFTCKDLERLISAQKFKMPGQRLILFKLQFICKEWERMNLCLS